MARTTRRLIGRLNRDLKSIDYTTLAIRHSDPLLVGAGFPIFSYHSVADHAGDRLFRRLRGNLAAGHRQIAAHLFDEKPFGQVALLAGYLGSNDRKLKMLPNAPNERKERGPQEKVSKKMSGIYCSCL
ncbi:hypothetical protein [Mesorhizobium sp. B2-8-9]|uniref:hypothetical protein n=1 Tax=Mesorhizobium sp. B2-8-9 TaxID=2589899 RepID=UPI001129B074|nr:hypothetical protein [Mesorhizobium sp. B2-8-9]TPI72528.1 hypothetical protein FJ423_27040 [Mesorhizobium sp. B2-8-9]